MSQRSKSMRRHGADYEVGYGKPPVETRFKRGQSGNPRGRPRRLRNIEALTERLLDQVVAIEDFGLRRHVSKRELGIIVLVKKALAGNPRAIRIVYKLMRKLDPRPPAPAVVTVCLDDNGKVVSDKRLEEIRAEAWGRSLAMDTSRPKE